MRFSPVLSCQSLAQGLPRPHAPAGGVSLPPRSRQIPLVSLHLLPPLFLSHIFFMKGQKAVLDAATAGIMAVLPAAESPPLAHACKLLCRPEELHMHLVRMATNLLYTDNRSAGGNDGDPQSSFLDSSDSVPDSQSENGSSFQTAAATQVCNQDGYFHDHDSVFTMSCSCIEKAACISFLMCWHAAGMTGGGCCGRRHMCARGFAAVAGQAAAVWRG